MIYPDFLKTNDCIGICAPSAGVGHKSESFSLSEDSLKSRGYIIKETANVRSKANPSATADVRGKEFNELFADKSVKAVYAATGGEYNLEMLPYVDLDLVKNNPKWFIGYSDPTSIEFLLTTKLDIATIYGTNAGSFDWQPLHKFHELALDILEGKVQTQESYQLYDSRKDWENINIDTPVKWELFSASPSDTTAEDAINAESSSSTMPTTAHFKGRLIGGCIDVLAKQIGTPYEDTLGFINRYEQDGFIWYFDNFELYPLNLYLTLIQMKLSGWFRNAKLIIFGRVMFQGEHSDEEYIELLKRAFPTTDFIWGADIGHTKPAMTLINGSICEVAYQDNKARLSMELL